MLKGQRGYFDRCRFSSPCLLELSLQRRALCLLTALFALLFLYDSSAEAQRVRKIRKMNPRSLSSVAIQEYEFSLSKELDRIVANSVDPSLFDPITLMDLRADKEIAEISWNSEDIDEEQTRRVVQKTLAIQTASTAIPAIKRSDLKDSFRVATQYYRSLTDLFRVSLQQDGEGVVLSKSKRGKSIMELNVDISPKNGFEPQIKFGENTRIRYDFSEGLPMLEFGTNF